MGLPGKWCQGTFVAMVTSSVLIGVWLIQVRALDRAHHMIPLRFVISLDVNFT